MGKLGTILSQKCPRCEEGELFVNKSILPFSKKPFEMYKYCPNCGLKYEKEVGFFYGAMFVSYALNIAIFVTMLVGYLLFFKESYGWGYLAIAYLLVTLLCIGLIFRFSRAIWLAIFNPVDHAHKDFDNLEKIRLEGN